MFKTYLWLLSICVGLGYLVIASNWAYGQNDTYPFLTPEVPSDGRAFFYSQRFLSCPTTPFPNADGESYWFYRDGQEIHLFIVSELEPCVIPPGPLVQRDIRIGPFPEGDYTLYEYRVLEFTTFPTTPDGLTIQSEIRFSIGPAPSAIPTLTGLGLGMLATMLLLLGYRAFTPISVSR